MGVEQTARTWRRTEDADPAVRREPKATVERVEVVSLGRLAPGPRARLGANLHALWSEYFTGQTLDAFTRAHLFDDTRVILAYGRAGDLAGFSYVNARTLVLGGQPTTVLGGGIFNRVEYASSGAVALRTLPVIAGLRLQQPRRPCVGVTVVTNPVAYDLMCRMVPVVAPRAGAAPPAEALAAVHLIAAARGLPISADDPWVVQFYGRPAQAERLRASRAYARRTEAMAWFEARAPRWAEGQALLAWAPLDAANLGGMFARVLGHQRRHG